MKELSEIAEKWSEEEYRLRPELSQSTLANYERLGYNGLDHLFDAKETPSLTFGSCVDAIITGGMEEFNRRFEVFDLNITDGGLDTIRQLLAMNLSYPTFEEIPAVIVSNAAKAAGFWQADKWDKKRYTEVLKTGDVGGYYNACKNSDKKIISSEVYNDVVKCVQALKESYISSRYFADNDPFSPVRRYYQLKFRGIHEGVGYRGMLDLVVVDHEKKVIYPCDLKTSSHYEWDFKDSFIQWQYQLQARLYWRLLRMNLDADEYFKDFKLENFRFIVVNKRTLTPLVWEFPYSEVTGTLIDSQGKEYRDPYEIGKELSGYLSLKPPVPNGIYLNKLNVINNLKPKEN